MSIEIQEKFKEYKLVVIKDFISSFMPPPENGKSKFFKIKSSDDFYIHIWGESAEKILQEFERFLNLNIFI